MGLFSPKKAAVNTTATTAGSPSYDAKIDPANAGEVSVIADRLQQQTALHLFSDKSAAARVFSHAYQASPSPTAIAMMGLGQQAQVVRDQMERTQDLPFSGQPLGPTPGVHASPVEPHFGPGGYDHLTHHAHKYNERATRRRFGA